MTHLLGSFLGRLFSFCTSQSLLTLLSILLVLQDGLLGVAETVHK
jgi:hypothetical protein